MKVFFVAFLFAVVCRGAVLRHSFKEPVKAQQGVVSSPLRYANISGSHDIHALPNSSARLVTVKSSTSSNKKGADVDLMICLPVRSASWLALLREAWVDQALATGRIGVAVFVPNNYGEVHSGGAEKGLNVIRLTNWLGDVSTFQSAVTGAMRPCSQQSRAKWYAMLDDDVILFPDIVLKVVETLDTSKRVLWGRKGQATWGSRVIYGGVMMMSSATTEAFVENMDDMYETVLDAVKARKCVLYKNTTGFNIDHFFSIGVQLLGGTLKEFIGIVDLKPEHAEYAFVPEAPVFAVHHVSADDFRSYNAEDNMFMRRAADHGAQFQLGKWCLSRSECLRNHIANEDSRKADIPP